MCTHGHPDHVGNNNLFTGPGVQHLVGWALHTEDLYTDTELQAGQPVSLAGDQVMLDRCYGVKVEGLQGRTSTVEVKLIQVVVLPTPGHTLDSVSVRVITVAGVVVIAGDTFEKEEDLEDESVWLEAGSEDEAAQRKSRDLILQMADYIVPGHGPMFKVCRK